MTLSRYELSKQTVLRCKLYPIGQRYPSLEEKNHIKYTVDPCSTNRGHIFSKWWRREIIDLPLASSVECVNKRSAVVLLFNGSAFLLILLWCTPIKLIELNGPTSPQLVSLLRLRVCFELYPCSVLFMRVKCKVVKLLHIFYSTVSDYCELNSNVVYLLCKGVSQTYLPTVTVRQNTKMTFIYDLLIIMYDAYGSKRVLTTIFSGKL